MYINIHRKSEVDVMRIIFVEGVSGVGKSTLSNKLCDKLCEMGYAAKAYLEFDFDNPIDFYCTAYFKKDEYKNLLIKYSAFSEDIRKHTIFADDVRLIRYYERETPLFTVPLLSELCKNEFCWKPKNLVPISEYTRVYKTVWEQFAEKVNNGLDYLIFDGSLFHHPINDMIRNYHVSDDQAACHVNTLIETVSNYNPLVCYLTSKSVSEQLEKARVSRNQTPAAAEQIKFWEERKNMDLAVIRQLPIPCDIYDISGENWDSVINTVIEEITRE
jgi:GTPase SAR1 family protein